MLEPPAHFLAVPYNAARHPGTVSDLNLSAGANCQLFAYALLHHYGLRPPLLRSSDLWEDMRHTQQVTDLKPLDLLLWNATPEAYGAHVGVYLGDDRAIHLSKKVGLPAVWTLKDFTKRITYRHFLGAKRCLARSQG